MNIVIKPLFVSMKCKLYDRMKINENLYTG